MWKPILVMSLLFVSNVAVAQTGRERGRQYSRDLGSLSWIRQLNSEEEIESILKKAQKGPVRPRQNAPVIEGKYSFSFQSIDKKNSMVEELQRKLDDTRTRIEEAKERAKKEELQRKLNANSAYFISVW